MPGISPIAISPVFSRRGGTGVSPYIVAYGGTMTQVGNFKVHRFTGDDIFNITYIPSGAKVEVFGVGGGGSGGGFAIGEGCGGGGGGEAKYVAAVTPILGINNVVIGKGGIFNITVNNNDLGVAGSTGTLLGVTVNGGGAGGGSTVNVAGGNGANGGGGGSYIAGGTGGVGTYFNGGSGNSIGTRAAGGGGGMGSIGGSATSGQGGAGGTGTVSPISGLTYAGGGGGSSSVGGTAGGLGGSGIGGNGSLRSVSNATSAVANTGSGGGGANSVAENTGNGSDGIWEVRYLSPVGTAGLLTKAYGYISIGQSNATDRFNITGNLPVGQQGAQNGIYTFINNGTKNTFQALNSGVNSTYLSAFVVPNFFAISNPLAYRLFNTYNKKSLLIPTAVGGTGLDKTTFSGAPLGCWDSTQSGQLYDQAVTIITNAWAAALNSGFSLTPVFLWMQGETDTTSSVSAANYGTNLQAFITNIRTALTAVNARFSNARFIITSLRPDCTAGTFVAGVIAGEVYVNGLALPNVYLHDMNTVRTPLSADGQHYNPASNASDGNTPSALNAGSDLADYTNTNVPLL